MVFKSTYYDDDRDRHYRPYPYNNSHKNIQNAGQVSATSSPTDLLFYMSPLTPAAAAFSALPQNTAPARLHSSSTASGTRRSRRCQNNHLRHHPNHHQHLPQEQPPDFMYTVPRFSPHPLLAQRSKRRSSSRSNRANPGGALPPPFPRSRCNSSCSYPSPSTYASTSPSSYPSSSSCYSIPSSSQDSLSSSRALPIPIPASQSNKKENHQQRGRHHVRPDGADSFLFLSTSSNENEDEDGVRLDVQPNYAQDVHFDFDQDMDLTRRKNTHIDNTYHTRGSHQDESSQSESSFSSFSFPPPPTNMTTPMRSVSHSHIKTASMELHQRASPIKAFAPSQPQYNFHSRSQARLPLTSLTPLNVNVNISNVHVDPIGALEHVYSTTSAGAEGNRRFKSKKVHESTLEEDDKVVLGVEESATSGSGSGSGRSTPTPGRFASASNVFRSEGPDAALTADSDSAPLPVPTPVPVPYAHSYIDVFDDSSFPSSARVDRELGLELDEAFEDPFHFDLEAALRDSARVARERAVRRASQHSREKAEAEFEFGVGAQGPLSSRSSSSASFSVAGSSSGLGAEAENDLLDEMFPFDHGFDDEDGEGERPGFVQDANAMASAMETRVVAATSPTHARSMSMRARPRARTRGRSRSRIAPRRLSHPLLLFPSPRRGDEDKVAERGRESR